MVTCQLCSRTFNDNNGLGKHLFRSHKDVSSEAYYLEYANLFKPPMFSSCPTCYCGKHKQFLSFSEGFSTHCSSSCHSKMISKDSRKKPKRYSPPKANKECMGCGEEYKPDGYSQKWCRVCRPKGHRRCLITHNLTQTEYDNMASSQDGKCALCDKPIAVVDHDHQTGRVRGLLCYFCNTALNRVETSGWVERANAYLEKPQVEPLRWDEKYAHMGVTARELYMRQNNLCWLVAMKTFEGEVALFCTDGKDVAQTSRMLNPTHECVKCIAGFTEKMIKDALQNDEPEIR